MLTKVLSIEGVGLLRDAKGGNSNSFSKLTLLYAENGRGKSTFASVLTSCTSRNPDLIEDRVTIDANVKPSARLMFGNALAEYKDGSWSGCRPEILVYDSNFVNSNVHTGNEVTSSQRANLLSFALGTSAVKARQHEQEATASERLANENAKKLREQLEALISGRIPLPQFRALIDDVDVDKKITEAEQKVAALSRAAEIKRQAMPREYETPELDLDHVFSVLNSTLESVHSRAAARVSEHLGHLNDANSVSWVQRGLSLARENECPFCGQDTSSVELLEMYRIYFDDAYTDLQKAVDEVSVKVLSLTAVNLIEDIKRARSRNNDALKQWAEYVAVAPIEETGDELAEASLVNLRDLLESLLARKTATITEAHAGEEEFEEAKRLWDQFSAVYADENSVIKGYIWAIETYKTTLDGADMDQLLSEIERLNLVKLRYSANAKALVEHMKAAEASVKDAETTKKDARDVLNQVMRDTLSDFKNQINEHLREFNAEFQIAELSHNYRGATPRTEYQIRLRNESIELNGGRPTFATALSEGDKKTMGFAFFAASTLADPDLGDKIVVIDDPMSSLDAPRREHTMKVIEKISARAKQVILMAHDEHFLRHVKERIRKSDDSLQAAEISIRMSEGRYSDFALADIEALCQSSYLKNYKLVSGVVAGTISDPDGVAQGAVALRLLLEGYLHRKYPEVIPVGVTLGKAITAIEQARGSDSPCASMASRVEELREMNDYASKFHHETRPDYDAAHIAPQIEISRNGEKILSFIHSA